MTPRSRFISHRFFAGFGLRNVMPSCDSNSQTSRNPKSFWWDEDGALIIFGLMIFGMMLAIGGLSFDMIRYETHRERLQSTLDRAVLSAASLRRTGTNAEIKAVVVDYLTKAGMENYIDINDIIVTQAVNTRKVEAVARIHVPLHHGAFEVFGGTDDTNQVLIAEANSIAEESIGNVEISMVLDVSGSMNDYNRIGNLQSAAGDFLDTIYDAAEPFAVSTSIVPYSTQVNAGPSLLSYFNRTNSHENSHCLNFTTNDFSTPAMSLISNYEQTLHFDPWTSENNTYGYAVGEMLPYPNCPEIGPHTPLREIMAWSTNKTQLKDYINTLTAQGNTSTDIGTKWGAALLDPSLAPALTGMIDDNEVHSNIAGRPYPYGGSDAMKIMVVMTDGVHTNQYYMDDYRSGDSFVWRYKVGNNAYYSIWHDGEGSTPNTDEETTWENQIVGYNTITYCRKYRRNGICRRWGSYQEAIYDMVEVPVMNWFVAYNTNIYSTSGSSYTRYEWRSRPKGIEDGAVRMTWDEVWAEIPPEYFSDEILYEMDTLSNSERNLYEDSIESVGGSTKNTRFDSICAASKLEGVIIFTIGLEVPDSYDARLRSCASSPAHYYDVSNLNMATAFASIASEINQLRLVQ